MVSDQNAELLKDVFKDAVMKEAPKKDFWYYFFCLCCC
jgi:hypothetical protein